MATIRVKSVGPLGHIYQRFSPLPIFSVDSHLTGTESTIKRTIETGGSKGDFIFETRVCDNNSISQSTKNLILVL